MHRNVPARSGWEIGDARFREVGFAGLPTMADTGEIDLRGFRAVYRRKWMLIGTMVVTMGATLFWLSQATHYYDADVLIVVETRPSSIVKVDEKVPDTISDVSKVNTEVAVLESRGLASRVIRDLQLDRDPEFTDATPDTDQQADDTGAETPSGGFQGEVIRAVLAEALSSVRSFFVSR
jgi:uncharacterized protein involved in exopolysaccharide biosynthesis